MSRRRVRELELELEACKKDVARERTRILEHEHSLTRDGELQASKKRVVSQRERVQQQQEQQKKTEDDQAELAAAEARYMAAVEEKKGEIHRWRWAICTDIRSLTQILQP